MVEMEIPQVLFEMYERETSNTNFQQYDSCAVYQQLVAARVDKPDVAKWL